MYQLILELFHASAQVPQQHQFFLTAYPGTSLQEKRSNPASIGVRRQAKKSHATEGHLFDSRRAAHSAYRLTAPGSHVVLAADAAAHVLPPAPPLHPCLVRWWP